MWRHAANDYEYTIDVIGVASHALLSVFGLTVALGENIRTLQEHLGHTNVETTEIYTHAKGTNAVISPMDRLMPALNIYEFHKTA